MAQKSHFSMEAIIYIYFNVFLSYHLYLFENEHDPIFDKNT